ncbi:MAG: hypothetical protein ACLVJO_09770 [[Clostridium] scindens]
MPCQRRKKRTSEDAGGEPQIDDVQDKAEDAGTGNGNAGTMQRPTRPGLAR